MMLLSICIPTLANHVEAWFTCQALRIYHDLTDVEIVLLDNGNDPHLEAYVNNWGRGKLRYLKSANQGTAAAKNAAIENAIGDWVLLLDSHVLLVPGALDKLKTWIIANPDFSGLFHGPLLYDDLVSTADAMNDEWRGHMWGTWRTATVDREAPPYEIPMHGMGLFGCKRDKWLGFNSNFRGFGGEEGYIHAKYRQAGNKILCLPFLQWNHYFRPVPAPYPVNLADRIRNYELGLDELKMDKTPMLEHFKDVLVTKPSTKYSLNQ